MGYTLDAYIHRLDSPDELFRAKEGDSIQVSALAKDGGETREGMTVKFFRGGAFFFNALTNADGWADAPYIVDHDDAVAGIIRFRAELWVDIYGGSDRMVAVAEPTIWVDNGGGNGNGGDWQEWLSKNWLLVAGGIVLLIFMSRRGK